MPDDTPPRPHPRDAQGADELAAEAVRCETEARTLRYQAKLLEAQAAVLRRREALARSGYLAKVQNKGTLGTMEALQANAGSKVSKAKTKHPWPFSAALHAHDSSPAQWALAQKPPRKPETVRAWLKAPGKGGRPIPMADALRIEAEFAGTDTPVPARDASWPNKIRQEP